MESLTKNKQTRATIAAMVDYIFHTTLAASEDAVIELKEGWFNVAYLIHLRDEREVILKIAPPRDAEVMTYEHGMMKSEVTLMKKAYALGVPCPQVYGYDDRHDLIDADYFFMEKLDGMNLEHVRESLTGNQLTTIHRQIGKWTAKWNEDTSSAIFGYAHHPDLQGASWKAAFLKMMHAVLRDGQAHQVNIGFDYADIQRMVEHYGYVLDEVEQPHFIHWDCWDSNVFVKGDLVTGILDFERGFFGDPLAEALFRMRIPAQLEGYRKTAFTPNEEIRMRLYDVYLFLIMVIEDSYRHYDTDGIRQFGYDQLQRIIPLLK